LGLSVLLRRNIALLKELDRGEKIGILGIVCAFILALLAPYIALSLYLAILLSIAILVVSGIALFWPRNRGPGLYTQGREVITDDISIHARRPSSAKQERYERLAKYVFRPLVECCTRLNEFRINAPNDLALDDSRIHAIITSPYFHEGREHLLKDLENNITRPEELHTKIVSYNDEAGQFLNVTLLHKIRREFEKISDLEISENQNDLPSNGVVLYTIVRNIRNYLLSHGENDPDLFYENGMLSEGHGLVILAVIPPELEAPVRNTIRALKHDYGLTSVLDGMPPIRDGLFKRRNDLIESGEA